MPGRREKGPRNGDHSHTADADRGYLRVNTTLELRLLCGPLAATVSPPDRDR